MPVMNGLTLLETLRSKGIVQPETAVLSAYDEFDYARKCIDFNVRSYVLKPIDPDKLRSALNRAYGALHGTRPHMLSVVCDHKDQLINVSSIRYLESKLHKVLIHCGTKVFATYARLNELQGRLPKHFSRCHQSYLVNLAYVSSFDGRQVLLHDGTPIPVSRRHAQTLQKDLLSYIKSHGR